MSFSDLAKGKRTSINDRIVAVEIVATSENKNKIKI
jgi:hypothetical protein